jgi:hypothetical protein
MRLKTSKKGMTALTLAMTPLLSHADNARDWQNLPTDLNMVFGYYNRINTNTPIGPALTKEEFAIRQSCIELQSAPSTANALGPRKSQCRSIKIKQ